MPTDRFIKKIDQGENIYSFRLGVVERDKLERATQEFTQKPYALNIFPTKATMDKKTFDVTMEDDTVALVTMKKADGRNAIIFRLHNNTENTVETALCAEGKRLPLRFGKYEVKTVLYENGALMESELLLI